MEENQDIIQNTQGERMELVIEDNTIYEIDLDCLDCLKKEKHKRI